MTNYPRYNHKVPFIKQKQISDKKNVEVVKMTTSVGSIASTIFVII